MKLKEYGLSRNSRIILALDRVELTRKVLDKVSKFIAAVKLGLPVMLRLGESKVKELIEYIKSYNLYVLGDMKIADIGYVSRLMVNYASNVGFDGIIAHAFIGYEDGLKDLVEEAHSTGIEVYTVCSMSHKGAEEVINRSLDLLVDISLKANVEGFILPATMPKYISHVRRRVGRSKLILSPGVGAQGAKPGSAIGYGADFEIIGRLIYNSSNPEEVASSIWGVLRWY